MKKTVIAICLMAAAICSSPAAAEGQEDLRSEIQQIKQQLVALEKKLEESQKAQEDISGIKSDVQQLKDTVTEPEGTIQTTISDVAKLKKIKVSGYVQARYESYQNPAGVNNLGNNKTLDNRFYLRRGRFKFTGQPTSNTLGVVQLDISGYDRAKVESKDLYLEYQPWGVGASGPFITRFGQQNWPFGYCIERSSSARETPERPKVFAGTTVSLPGYPSFNGLFPGERDKGVCLLSTESGRIDWALGVFNATGTKAGSPGNSFLEADGKFEDNNGAKAIVGRARYPVAENVNFGMSFYNGSQAVRTVSTATDAVNVAQTRWGADFQWYLPGASIKGEYVVGKEPYYSNTTTTPNGKSGTNRTVSGWYIVGVKNIGDKNQLVAQYDVLDDRAMANTFGKLSTWNLGIIRFLDDATKLKVFYEINNEQKNHIRNNGLRVEVLIVF